MVPVQELPNRLLIDGRAVLARYGYRHMEAMPDAGAVDWAALWDQLRGDFATHDHPTVPLLGALSGEAAAAARAYMVCGLDADLKLDRCEALHVRLFGEGIATDLVENYAVARDAYEDAVEAFGAAGARLTRLLFSH
ncbi:hypothetical protein [Azospirillum sp. TSO22-1]|uniref:hypothetical protein n=1 Tax=Azospirillum sp. TSO22-1 TaxID=716789 RepID=UPI000D607156|nr:hypothetical protein [Azospirillum sp. TSO22-1]PWC45897.1 hypothetical protein TSO221_15205 [Azospirillum sp. TSO22-1]